MTDRPDPAETLPDSLTDAMREASAPGFDVPDSTSHAVLDAAGRHLATVRVRQRRSRWRWALPPAAAAMVAMAILLFGPGDGAARPGDLDGSGAVDVLDVFALSRQVEAGEAELDINGDGVVNEQDVDALAQRIVSLDEEAM